MKRILVASFVAGLLSACNKSSPPAESATPSPAPTAAAEPATPEPNLPPELRVRETRRLMREISEATNTYRNENKQECPPDLAALVSKHYLTHEPKDPWGNRLAFTCPADHYPFVGDLVSNGPDGKSGTADDLHSWDPEAK